MPQVFVLDVTTERVRSVITNDSPEACPYWGDTHEQDIHGLLTYEFTVPAEHEQADLLDEDCPIVFTDLDDSPYYARVKQVIEEAGDSGRIKTVKCEGAHYELADTPVRPRVWVNKKVDDILYDILQVYGETRWDVGEVTDKTISYQVDDYTSALDVIRTLAETLGWEFYANVEFDGDRITARTIDLLKPDDEAHSTGKVMEYARDSAIIRRTRSTLSRYTALIGLGRSTGTGYVTFTNVVWNESGDFPYEGTDENPAKPSNQDWIGCDEWRDEFGIPLPDGSKAHRIGIVRFDTILAPEGLLERTWELLKKTNSKAADTYEVDARRLDNLPPQGAFGADGFEYERVNLGDYVTVRDLNFDPPLDAKLRVSAIKRSYTSPQSESADGTYTGGAPLA